MRWWSALAMCVLAAAAPGAASAQAPPPEGPFVPTPPAPAAGRMSIKLIGGIATRRLRYVTRGQRVVVVGRVRPFVAGQVATLRIVRRRRVLARYRVPIAPLAGGGGGFTVRVPARRAGSLRLVAKHAGTGQQAAFRARAARLEVVWWRAGAGASGTRVLLLQRTLRSLGFATPVTGYYDAGTSRAVLTFRKTNGMGRIGYASPSVYAKVFRHEGRFRLKYPGAGRHVEFDWSRQVLVLADRGRAVRVYHASSGKPSTPTVFGAFRFYSKQPGTNSHGMVDSSYFIGAYAIHGYPSVPSYAASHGCIRIPIPNAAQVFRQISLGERVFVYR